MADCNDRKCPFHAGLKTRLRKVTGTVVSQDTHRTATIEYERKVKVPKYERYEKRRTKLQVHNPACLNAQLGDVVVAKECRPLSKSKTFVIVEKVGEKELFAEEMEAREQAKAKPIRQKKEEKEESKLEEEVKQEE